MSRIYLVRHGQAGTRQAYDELSPLGRTQARHAGDYLAAQGICFRAALSGSLRRQRETAAEAACAYTARGLEFPEIITDPGWNEFDLDTVYRDISAAIAAEDAQFRREFAELQRLAADGSHEVHRRWSRCDAAIVEAWVEGRYPSRAESWEAFIARVQDRLNALPRLGPDESIVVFTSAIPISIWVAMALGAANDHILPLAGVMYNSAITTFRLHDGALMLFDFNGVPHLPDAALRSFR